MEKIKEEVPEKLRIAVLLSFISGYINAFTYNNAGELFAGAQTGNVIFMALHFAKGNLEKAVEFLIPIISFNRQSAAKPEKESSTTIPREGSTIQAIGIGSGFA